MGLRPVCGWTPRYRAGTVPEFLAFCPNGAQGDSPGQRPVGWNVAIESRPEGAELNGTEIHSPMYPGRRFALPWAISFCPFGAGKQKKTHRAGTVPVFLSGILPPHRAGTAPEFLVISFVASLVDGASMSPFSPFVPFEKLGDCPRVSCLSFLSSVNDFVMII